MKIYVLKKDKKNFKDWIEKTKCDPYSVEIINRKTYLDLIFFKDAKIEFANILKQTALSVGCDCSIGRDVISGDTKRSDILFACTRSQLLKIKEKLKNQPFSLEKSIDDVISMIEYKDSFFVQDIDLLSKKKFLMMGVLNVTPDSFYDGGKYDKLSTGMKRVEEMLDQNVDIIDVGGQSTRPYSEPVNVDLEIKRVLPFVEAIIKRFPEVILSVDTYNSKTADICLSAGAKIINDISGLNFDGEMKNVVSRKKASVILMHIKGTPQNMQNNPVYDDLLLEIVDFLRNSIDKAEEAGIEDNRISIDPGIGFGKTVEHNLKILNNLDIFTTLKKPLTVGVSNKSFIGKILDRDKDERIFGTLGANVVSLINGAKIFRVHNVKENFEALKIAMEIFCN